MIKNVHGNTVDLLGEDIHYAMRTVVNAQTRDRRRSVQPPTTWIFNDSKFQLERRVARLETGMAWAEEPPSRTRHLIANIEIEPGDADESGAVVVAAGGPAEEGEPF